MTKAEIQEAIKVFNFAFSSLFNGKSEGKGLKVLNLETKSKPTSRKTRKDQHENNNKRNRNDQ